MKNYRLLGMMPNTNQFFTFIKESTGNSDFNTQTVAYKTVYGLFANAQALYKTLEFHTSERLSTFAEAKKYLTSAQERDLVALTTLNVLAICNSEMEAIINQDPIASDKEKEVLKLAVKLFRDTAQATYNAVGNPRWIDE